MAIITLRQANVFNSPNATIKGTPLTNSEVDNNFANINVELTNLGNVFFANGETKTEVFTTSGTSQQTAFSFNASVFRSGEYFVQMTSGSNVHITKIHLTHNTTNAFLSQFGDVVTNQSVGTFDADISSGSVRLRVTPVVSGTVLKSHATLLKI
jgi:hypothetical protein